MPEPFLDFNEIPQFPKGGPSYDVSWSSLETHIAHDEAGDPPLCLRPDFQRGHVWTEEQRVRYVEYLLRGGSAGRDLLFNCRGWTRPTKGESGPYEIIDGLQRLTSVRMFLAGNLHAFGRPISMFTGRMRYFLGFRWVMFELSRPEVLQLYIDLNAAGTPHAESEIARVRALLAVEQAKGTAT